MIGMIRRSRYVAKARNAARAQVWTSAVDYYLLATSGGSARSKDLVQLGHALRHTGDPHRAEEAYRRAIEAAPRWAEPYRQLGYLLWDRGRDADAVRLFATALGLRDSDVSLRRILGEAGMSAGDQELAILDALEALPVLRRSDDLSPRFALAMRHRSVARKEAKAGQWAKAAQQYVRYLRGCPNDGAAWMQLGHCRKQLGDVREAEDAYRTAVAMNGPRGDDLRHLGFLLREMGKYDAANAVLHVAMRLLDHAPDVADALDDLLPKINATKGATWSAPAAVLAAQVHPAERAGAVAPKVAVPEHLSPISAAELQAVVAAIIAARKAA